MSSTVSNQPDERPELTGVIDALRNIVWSLQVTHRVAEQQLGLTASQLLVLHRIAETTDCSVNDVARRTYTHQSTVSVVVDRLVRRRLVRRARSSEDGRRVALSLTPSGRALLGRAVSIAQIRLFDALGALSTSDLRVLSRCLGRVARSMGAGAQRPPMFFQDADPARRPGAAVRRPRPARAAGDAEGR